MAGRSGGEEANQETDGCPLWMNRERLANPRWATAQVGQQINYSYIVAQTCGLRPYHLYYFFLFVFKIHFIVLVFMHTFDFFLHNLFVTRCNRHLA